MSQDSTATVPDGPDESAETIYEDLDWIPSSSSSSNSETSSSTHPLSPARRRIYSMDDLHLYDLLTTTPVYVFDCARKCMRYANPAALSLWSADSLDTLLARDFGTGMSQAIQAYNAYWMKRFHSGDTEAHSLTWTFHPNGGRDGPRQCTMKTSGIFLTRESYRNAKNEEKSTTAQNDEEQTTSSTESTTTTRHTNQNNDSDCHFCMLVVVEKVVIPTAATTDDDENKSQDSQSTSTGAHEASSALLRRTEMLKYFPICARQFDCSGNLMDQNAQAFSVFGAASHHQDDQHQADNEFLDGQKTNTINTNPQMQLEKNRSPIGGTTVPDPPENKNNSLNDFLAQFVDLEEGKRVWEKVQQHGTDYSTEILQRTIQGKDIWFSINVRSIQDPITSEPVVIYSARDITSIMNSAQERAAKENQAKHEFFAVMAHEIRTPLHQVVGMIEVLAEAPQYLSDDQKDSVRILQTSSHALMAIINDVLDFTKLEAGQMKLEQVSFEVRGVMEGCVAAVQQQVKMKRHLTMVMEMSNAIPIKLRGDPNRLRQIILNLLTNAIKFSNRGTITLRATLADNPHDKNSNNNPDVSSDAVWLRFEVQDPGVGISQEQQDLIFDAYQQADVSVSRNYGGTGLGLAICKNLTQHLMKGRIGVGSELGKGSTFWFSVPFEPSATVDVPQELGVEEDTSTKLPSERVLVVEDNKINQKVIGKMLGRLGHTFVLAENGKVALDVIEKSKPFDIVLMDWQMPVMDGIDATKEIRNRGYTSEKLPVVGLTASIQGLDWQKIGMNDCVKKPIRLDELKRALAENRPKPPAILESIEDSNLPALQPRTRSPANAANVDNGDVNKSTSSSSVSSSRAISLEQRLYRALQGIPGCFFRTKEFNESIAFVNAVRSALPKRATKINHLDASDGRIPPIDLVIDVAGGHGAIAALFLILTSATKAVVVDPAQVGNSIVTKAWRQDYFPNKSLRFRHECLRTGMPDEISKAVQSGTPLSRILVVACHACQHLSEDTLSIATQHGVFYCAVLPCCQKDASPGSPWKATSRQLNTDFAVTMDLLLAGKAMQSYDSVKMRLLDPKITPQNRIIVCSKNEELNSKKELDKEASHRRLVQSYSKAHEQTPSIHAVSKESNDDRAKNPKIGEQQDKQPSDDSNDSSSYQQGGGPKQGMGTDESTLAATESPTPLAAKPRLFLVITNIQKRTNIRHLLMTAAAFGCQSVFVVGQRSFDWNVESSKDIPSTVKPSLDQALLTLQSFADWESCVNHLRENRIRLVGVEIHPEALGLDELLQRNDSDRMDTAFLMGNEGQGIHAKHMASCDMFVRIPQYGVGTASLNVYVACSIVLQRYHEWQRTLEVGPS